ncbi:DNA-binding transcriptional ArsR family regulator [Streptacidiphilus sp. MAP12-20]|uniref:ArsR/SmtB family transcription factor n=1 Tax=Streptacidiphilus sp. MAP12-20 TaxID=3156299 RepID=UPI0035195779
MSKEEHAEPTAEPTAEPPRTLDPRSLRALAHPLRMRLLELLTEGPATGTMLAERVGESTGTVSWHLRNLAQHGYIEEDRGRGSKRERWWRRVETATVVNTAEHRGDPEARAALSVYLQETVQLQFRRVSDYLSQEWPEDWRGTGNVSDFSLRLPPERLRELNAELMAVVERYRPSADTLPEPGALPVTVQFQTFPRRETDAS